MSMSQYVTCISLVFYVYELQVFIEIHNMFYTCLYFVLVFGSICMHLLFPCWTLLTIDGQRIYHDESRHDLQNSRPKGALKRSKMFQDPGPATSDRFKRGARRMSQRIFGTPGRQAFCTSFIHCFTEPSATAASVVRL